jgi:hypothetical protein
MKFKVQSTELPPMCLSQQNTCKTGTKKIFLRKTESHSMIGSQKTRKLLRLSFFLLDPFKEQRTMSKSSSKDSKITTGFGKRRLMKHLKHSMQRNQNLKISMLSLVLLKAMNSKS